jgi:hypothetical protein
MGPAVVHLITDETMFYRKINYFKNIVSTKKKNTSNFRKEDRNYF